MRARFSARAPTVRSSWANARRSILDAHPSSEGSALGRELRQAGQVHRPAVRRTAVIAVIAALAALPAALAPGAAQACALDDAVAQGRLDPRVLADLRAHGAADGV